MQGEIHDRISQTQDLSIIMGPIIFYIIILFNRKFNGCCHTKDIIEEHENLLKMVTNCTVVAVSIYKKTMQYRLAEILA